MDIEYTYEVGNKQINLNYILHQVTSINIALISSIVKISIISYLKYCFTSLHYVWIEGVYTTELTHVLLLRR